MASILLEMDPLVSITMVTFNSARHLQRCLDSLRAQDYSRFELIVVDNASTDGSACMFEDLPFPANVIPLTTNTGFSRGQNLAIRKSSGHWILCLNPDTSLEPNCISELVRMGELDDRIGMVCPKILRLENSEACYGNATSYGLVASRLDSAGVYMSRELRHHDRGSQEIDHGQYDTPEYIFGYTGAAVLFRRAMIEDISVNGEFMDEDFFAYREDADLSWRAQLLGWRAVYTPTAVSWHLRRVFADNRRSLPSCINMHSTKNRFLMRIKNITPRVYRKVWFKTTLRDLGILAYVLLREWSSIPGLWWTVRHISKLLLKRRSIQSRRRVSDQYLADWFEDAPISLPLEPELAIKWRKSATASGRLAVN